MNLLSNLKANIEVKAEGHRTAKLLDTIGGWFGFTAKQIRDEADAKAYEKIKLAEAQQQVVIIENDTDAKLRERAITRQNQQSFIHQQNIEDISIKAAGYLNEIDEGEINGEPVTEEWKAQFFEYAKNITQEQLQELWAKLLAEEIAKPNFVSARALHILYHLSAREATLFQNIARFVIDDGLIISTKESLEFFQIDYSDFYCLQEAGLLILSDPMIRLNYMDRINGYVFPEGPIRINDKSYEFKGPPPSSSSSPYIGGILGLTLTKSSLTSTGILIANITELTRGEEYFHVLADTIGPEYSFVELSAEEIVILNSSTN